MAITYDWTNTTYHTSNHNNEQNQVKNIINRVGNVMRRNLRKFSLQTTNGFANIVNGIRGKNVTLEVKSTYHNTGQYLGHNLMIKGAVGWITVRTGYVTYHVYELTGGKQFKITFYDHRSKMHTFNVT